MHYLNFSNSIKDATKAWIDALKVFASRELKLLAHLNEFFTNCSNYNLHLSATNSFVYTKQVTWLGTFIYDAEFQLHPSNIVAMRRIKNEITANELFEFIYCFLWMSSYTPEYHGTASLLNGFCDGVYDKARKLKRRALKFIALHKLSWVTVHEAAVALI